MTEKVEGTEVLEGDEQGLELVSGIVMAFEDLPIIERLNFARNMIFQNGGDPNSLPRDANLVLAEKVIERVVVVLRGHPAAAKLSSPTP